MPQFLRSQWAAPGKTSPLSQQKGTKAATSSARVWAKKASNSKPWWGAPVEKPTITHAISGSPRAYIQGVPEGLQKKTLIVEISQKQSNKYYELIKTIRDRIVASKLSKTQCRALREELLAAEV